MNIHKILMTGASGMLGSSMQPILRKKGYEVVPANFVVPHFDVRDVAQVGDAISITRPDIVIHLAAETNVDLCEQQPDHAYQTNTIGTQNIALVCQQLNIPLLYVSTIGVFYGDKKEPYTEFDIPRAANTYGWSKYEGEKMVQQLLSRYYIVRAGWMMGGGPDKDKKFIGKIINQLKDNASIRAVNDKIGSPTYVVDFSHVVANLIESNFYGLYHCTNKGYASRYDVAKLIVEVLGLKTEVIPVDSTVFPLPAPRADSEMSRNYMLDLRHMNTMRDWKVALTEYLKEYWL